MIFIDTETCGLHGPIILLQYAEDDGPVKIHSVWNSPISETLQLIEWIVTQPVVGFNLAFDWFHICQLYTTLLLSLNHDEEPDPIEYAMNEPDGRDGPCLKPAGCLDLMLHARKGPYQSTMDREEIRIKRVPSLLATQLVNILNQRIQFPPIYFERRQDKTQWHTRVLFDDFGDPINEFVDIVLTFAPSHALKALAHDALGIKEESIIKLEDIQDTGTPEELGYAPFALSGTVRKINGKRKVLKVGPGNWRKKWPTYINKFISFWNYNPLAAKYAGDDILYTRGLYHYFDKPAINDYDSVLACMVGATRWKGFRLDIPGLEDLKKQAQQRVKEVESQVNFKSPALCKRYMQEVLTDMERLAMMVNGKTTTKGVILEEISRWKQTELCGMCLGAGCPNCENGLISTDQQHKAAERAQLILDGRHAMKEIELFDKLLLAGRFHASLKVIGALSSRMSGADGLNPQGIKSAKSVRSKFPLSPEGMVLDGGDFDSFEVNIVDAVYGDPKLHAELKSGKKIHGILGTFFFHGMSYEDICKTSGMPGELDKYKRSKNGVFALIYMGTAYTLQNRVGIPKEQAEAAYQNFINEYTVFGEKRNMYADMFCSMRQPNGIGTKVEWHEPKDFIETLYGFKRYFTLENRVCKLLYELAQKPPENWKNIKLKVRRRDRDQTAGGAAQSALYAAAFALQAANMRAAGNHVIQGTGAQLTKMLQEELWSLQPSGINDWQIMLLNIHDEIMSPSVPALQDGKQQIVESFIEKHRSKVPLIGMKWMKNLNSWGEK